MFSVLRNAIHVVVLGLAMISTPSAMAAYSHTTTTTRKFSYSYEFERTRPAPKPVQQQVYYPCCVTTWVCRTKRCRGGRRAYYYPVSYYSYWPAVTYYRYY